MNTLDGSGTAQMMIKIYGPDAQSEARRRCEKALTQDDMPRFERWAHIAAMIGVQFARAGVQPFQHYH